MKFCKIDKFAKFEIVNPSNQNVNFVEKIAQIAKIFNKKFLKHDVGDDLLRLLLIAEIRQDLDELFVRVDGVGFACRDSIFDKFFGQNLVIL